MSDRQPAPKDGVQTVNGLRFRAVRGELMLAGATFVDPAQEAKDAHAPVDAAKAAKSGKGPDATTDASGPKATS